MVPLKGKKTREAKKKRQKGEGYLTPSQVAFRGIQAAAAKFAACAVYYLQEGCGSCSSSRAAAFEPSESKRMKYHVVVVAVLADVVGCILA